MINSGHGEDIREVVGGEMERWWTGAPDRRSMQQFSRQREFFCAFLCKHRGTVPSPSVASGS